MIFILHHVKVKQKFSLAYDDIWHGAEEIDNSATGIMKKDILRMEQIIHALKFIK